MQRAFDSLLYFALRGERQALTLEEDPRELSPRLRAHHAVLFERVQNQIKKDLAPITLADGSQISLKKARTILARKEGRDTFGNLRDLIATSHAPFVQRERVLSERFADALAHASEEYRKEFGHDAPFANEDDSGLSLSESREQLRTLSQNLEDAALVSADVLGGVRKGHDLQRALERPNGDGFYANQGAQKLSRTLKSVLPTESEAHVIQAPSALLGRVISQPQRDEPIVMVSEVLRADAFLRLLRGRCCALLWGLLDEQTPKQTLELLANAFSLSLTSAPSLRGVFHDKKAKDHARELMAVRVLKTFLNATLLSYEQEQEGKERIFEVLGMQSPRFESDFLRPPLWPTHRSQDAERAHQTFTAAKGAQIFQTFRSHFDESFALFAEAPHALLALKDALKAPQALFAPDFELASPKEAGPGPALVALLWEMI